MKTTVEALQDYYVEAGGQLADVADITTIPDMIDAITALGGGSGSSLPAVTSDDNGKLLTVVEGAWDKAEASGGNTLKIVKLTSGGQLPSGVTYASILADYNNGILTALTNAYNVIFHLSNVNYDANNQLSFASIPHLKNSKVDVDIITISSTNSVNSFVVHLAQG